MSRRNLVQKKLHFAHKILCILLFSTKTELLKFFEVFQTANQLHKFESRSCAIFKFI